MSNDNSSLVLKKKGDLCLENYPVPEPGPRELLIAIHYTGICGSDIHLWLNGWIGASTLEKPLVIGHESSGTVVKVGKEVLNFKPGDRIAIEPAIACLHCDVCKTGRYNLCSSVKGCAADISGTCCQYYAHPAEFCHKLPPHVSFEEGALLEPLSVAVHACRRAGVTAGSFVLICGAGPVGLLNMMVARAMGATHICLTDICDNRLKVAEELGSNFQINVSNKDENTFIESVKQCLGKLPDITIECSGIESSVRLAVQVTRPGGTVMIVGHGGSETTLPLTVAAIREVDIKGSFRYANDHPVALSLISSGIIDVKPLITHKFELKKALEAFETARSRESRAIKVLIQCQNEEN